MAELGNLLTTCFRKNKKGSFVIFTKAGCQYCVEAKSIIENLGAIYEEFDVPKLSEKVRTQLQSHVLGHGKKMTVPQIFYYDGQMGVKYIGGCDDLKANLK